MALIKGKEFRHTLFAKHYALTGNGGESARKAGYSPKSAHRTAKILLELPKVQQTIEETRLKITNSIDNSIEGLCKDLNDIRLAKIKDCKAIDKINAIRLIAEMNGHINKGNNIDNSKSVSFSQMITEAKKLSQVENKNNKILSGANVTEAVVVESKGTITKGDDKQSLTTQPRDNSKVEHKPADSTQHT